MSSTYASKLASGPQCPPPPPLNLDTSLVNKDPFAGYYSYWTHLAFSRLKPNAHADVFSLIQMLYSQNPNTFQHYSGLHQNTKDDQLHYSVRISSMFASYFIHIYGWWRNPVFVITHMTYVMTSNTGSRSPPQLLANFEITESPSDDTYSDN